MHFNDKVYQEFLKEMQALESFRLENSKLYTDTPLEQLEDPDTKRLIEALAFFSARNRVHGERTINATHEKIFRQYFPYLLSSLPTMGLVEFATNLRCVDEELVPLGTELIFQTPDEIPIYFQTFKETKIWPIFYNKLNFEPLSGGKARLHLHFSALHTNLVPIDSVELFINHLGSFLPSAYLLYALLAATESVSVTYDGDDNRTEPAHLEHVFDESSSLFPHPVEQIRSQLHLPAQELFLKVAFNPASKRWKSLHLTFELDRLWPQLIELTKESFVLNVAPVINLKRETADPICDEGLKESYPVLYPDPSARMELHSVMQVYQVNSTKTEPLMPALLGVKGNTYDMDYVSQRVSLDIQGVLTSPKTVIVDGFWSQPWFAEKTRAELKVSLFSLSTSGIEPRLLGSLVPGESPFIEQDPALLLKLLALKNQSHLSLDEIFLLCNSMKKIEHSCFNYAPEWIQSCRVQQQIDQLGVALSIEYIFDLNTLDQQTLLLALIFFRQIHRFLNCWLSNFHVQTKLNTSSQPQPIVYMGESYREFNLLARNIFLHKRN